MVIIAVLLGATYWEIANGRTPEPFAPVLCAGAIAYLGSILWLRRRS